MFNHFRIFLLFFLLSFSPFKGLASDFRSPRTNALGGAGHASPLLNDSIYLNPSYTSFMPVHALTFNYLTFRGGTINTPAGISDYYGNNMNVSILDGTADSLFQAGVGYTRRDDGKLIHIGASKSFLQKWGVGLGFKLLFPKDQPDTRISDFSLSSSGIIASWFQAAIIVDNLLERGTDQGFYREFTVGTKFNVDSILFIYFDPNWVPTYPSSDERWGYEAGVEFPFFRDLFLRIGTFKNATIPYQNKRGNGYGFGVGWLSPKISFDYSFSKALQPIAANSHEFGITLFF